MDGGDWFGLIAALTPLLALLIYFVLRLTGKVSKPEGLPTGRRGGVNRLGAMRGAPLSDAPYYSKEHADEPKDSSSSEDLTDE
jgi:hypothetical protein